MSLDPKPQADAIAAAQGLLARYLSNDDGNEALIEQAETILVAALAPADPTADQPRADAIDQFAFARPAKRGRMTVSLDPALVAWTKACAKRNDVSVSAVVELALQKARRYNGEASDE